MRRTPGILATTALLVLAAVPAHASGCPSLTDPAGDAIWDVVPAVTSGARDIVSADVSTGPTTLVATLRLASLSPSTSSGFTTWRLGWGIGGATHAVEARVATGQPIAVYSSPSGSVPVSFTVDRAASTVTWTVPRSAVPGLTGASLSNLYAMTALLSTSADEAFAPGTFHVDGTPGCIPAA